MTSLLLTSTRAYLKYPVYILYRHLSILEHRHNDPFILTTVQIHADQENQWNCLKVPYHSKRYITLQARSTEEQKSSSNQHSQVPIEFPAGNPSDRPKLEHLRFIENQLIQILPDFCKRMHPLVLYTSDVIFENNYDDQSKIIKGINSYGWTLFLIRTKLNFKLMNIDIHLLKTTIDEESDCVKIRWRISGLSNKSFLGILKSWRKPKDIVEDLRDYIEHIDGLSTFYVRGDGRVYKHRVDRMMIDEDKELATSPLDRRKLTATAPMSM